MEQENTRNRLSFHDDDLLDDTRRSALFDEPNMPLPADGQFEAETPRLSAIFEELEEGRGSAKGVEADDTEKPGSTTPPQSAIESSVSSLGSYTTGTDETSGDSDSLEVI